MQLGIVGLGGMGGNMAGSNRDRIEPTLQSLAPEIGTKPMTLGADDAARRDMIPRPGIPLRARRLAATW